MDVQKELDTLRHMTVDGLRSRYAEVTGEKTNSRHREWLVKRIIWRVQSQAEGDLTERARQRAAELADDADLRRRVPKSLPVALPAKQTRLSLPSKSDPRVPLFGSVITRVYKGAAIQVNVLIKGFEYEGETFKSLSAVAKKITGTHCNGYHFFRLTKEGNS